MYWRKCERSGVGTLDVATKPLALPNAERYLALSLVRVLQANMAAEAISPYVRNMPVYYATNLMSTMPFYWVLAGRTHEGSSRRYRAQLLYVQRVILALPIGLVESGCHEADNFRTGVDVKTGAIYCNECADFVYERTAARTFAIATFDAEEMLGGNVVQIIPLPYR